MWEWPIHYAKTRCSCFWKKDLFFFLIITPEKICKGGDELEEVMDQRNVIQLSEDIPELFLMLYCSDPKVQHLPETEGMNVFRKAKYSWFQMQGIKCLKTEAWICLSISLPRLKTKGWLEYLWINYEWIFLLTYAISPLPKQHCKAILALTKLERERKTKRSEVWESNFTSPNLKRPGRKALLLIRARVCNKLTHMFQISNRK